MSGQCQHLGAVVTDAILRDVFQGKRNHLRDQMISVASRAIRRDTETDRSNQAESGPRRWRKKPVEIEACRFVGSLEGHLAVDRFIGDSPHEHFDGRGWAFNPEEGEYVDVNETPDLIDGGTIEIITLEGRMEASPGDYVIRGVQGEFYPCKPDIFEATYEPVEVPRG